MDIPKLQRAIIDALEDVKAEDIRVFDTTKISDLFDRVIIATGNSNRQTKSLAMSVKESVKEKGADVISVEGMETGEWVLVDYGDVVVHVFFKEKRYYYQLEELWSDGKLTEYGEEGKKGKKINSKTKSNAGTGQKRLTK